MHVRERTENYIFFAAAFLAGRRFLAAFLAGAFLATAFFFAAFLAGARFLAAFLAGAFLAAAFFFAAGATFPPWDSSMNQFGTSKTPPW